MEEGSTTVGEPVFPKKCVQCGDEDSADQVCTESANQSRIIDTDDEASAGENKMLRCAQCKSSYYCSKSCQKLHWSTHKVICGSIVELEKQERMKCEQACDFSDSSLGSTGKQKLLQLIGDQCTVKCSLNGRECSSLWDTGAQISLISQGWLNDQHIESEVRDLSELIGRDLKVKGAVGTDIPYCGYVVLDCTITGVTTKVPFLVSQKQMEQPIIGYNVISYLATNHPDKVTVSCVKDTFPDINTKTAEAVLNILQTKELEVVSSVKLHKFDSLIRKGASISVPCRIANVKLERQSPVLFEPESEELLPQGLELSSELLTLKKGHNRRLCVTVTNVSGNDILLPGRTRLGDLFLVTSVTPAEVTQSKSSTKSEAPAVEEARRPLSGPMVTLAGAGRHLSGADQALLEQTSPQSSVDDSNSSHLREPVISSVSESTDTSLDDKYRVQLEKIKLPPELSEEQKQQVRDMLWRERRAFAEDADTIGSAEDLQMDISTEDEIPVQKRYNSIPQPLLLQVKGHVEDMLNRGWITRSASAWSSPVVIVRKQSGDIRLCCDFRQLNAKTIADKHPLPRVQESLDSLNGSEWFTVVDLTRAYYQGYISPESRHKTAFVTPWGFYQWVRIPFGLMNAPSNFQRYMENVIGDLRGKCALPYLDDIIIHSKTFSDHVQHIGEVLQRLQQHGMKLKADKCELFRQEVKFLGRIVSKKGYRMDDKNIKAVRALLDIQPKDVSEVRQLLGLLGYHRRHIQDFSRLAKPITDLLLKSNISDSEKNPKKAPIVWTDECKAANAKLIEMITSSPILSYADFEKQFILHTDASKKGLGAILYQKDDDGRMHVIGYGSRTLRKAEMNYHPTKLEFLALKWAVTEEFHEYLGYANDFQVFTDNNPLVYLMQATKLNAFAERWVSELAEYNFKISYRPGVVNKDADCLSRLPLDISKYTGLCTESIEPNVFEAVMAGLKVQVEQTEAWRTSLGAANDLSVNMISLENEVERVNVQKAQEDDDILSQVITMINAGVKPNRVPGEARELRRLKLEMEKLSMKDGVLTRKTDSTVQIVLPKSLRQHVYDELHAGMGHLGADRVGELARRRVYWPGMQQDIERYIQTQCSCLKQRKPPRKKSAAMQRIVSSSPLELVTIDFLHLEKGAGNYEYILVIVDHFTKFAQAYPTKNKSTTTAARHLYQDFLLRFGIPAKLLSDQGKEFDSKVIHELCKLTGVKKIRTTPYHPQGNGITERMNRTILHMLRTLPETAKSKWPSLLNKLVHAYNCTQHSVTGYTPFRLMFGREPTLPIDLLLGITSENKLHVNHTEFAKKFEKEMKQAWEIVKRNQKQNQDQNANQAMRKPLLTPVRAGDRVLIRNTETGGPGKLRSYWEQDVYIVLAEKGDQGVVVEVRKENDPKARRRVVHRNMLLLVDQQYDKMKQGETMQAPAVEQARRPLSGPMVTLAGAGRHLSGADQLDRDCSVDESESDTEDSEDEGFLPSRLSPRTGYGTGNSSRFHGDASVEGQTDKQQPETEDPEVHTSTPSDEQLESETQEPDTNTEDDKQPEPETQGPGSLTDDDEQPESETQEPDTNTEDDEQPEPETQGPGSLTESDEQQSETQGPDTSEESSSEPEQSVDVERFITSPEAENGHLELSNENAESRGDSANSRETIEAVDECAGYDRACEGTAESTDMDKYLQRSPEPYFLSEESYNDMFSEEPMEFEGFRDESMEVHEVEDVTAEMCPRMLETVLEESDEEEQEVDEVPSREARRSRLPKSLRDLLDFNNTGLKQDDYRQGRVDAACSPGTRSRVRRVSQRLQDLERKQASREEALLNKRGNPKLSHVSVSHGADVSSDWRSWLAI